MIYELTNNLDHISEEGGDDAELIYYDNWQDVRFFNPAIDEYAQGLPNPVEYTGNSDTLSWLDHPSTPSTGLLISKRMVDVLLSVRPFAHRAFPVRIYSNTVADILRNLGGQRTKRKITDPTLFTDKFVILKLMSYTDCLDADNTIVNDMPFSQTRKPYVNSSFVTHYAFVAPLDGFPPVFLPPELSFYCWSEEAKAACEQAGLRGLKFRPVR